MSDQYIKFLALRIYRNRDAKAFDELYDLYWRRLHRYLLTKLPRPEDATEITSEVFLRGWEYMTSSRVDNVTGLVYRIARNLVADFYRTQKTTESLDDHEPFLAAPGSLEKEVMVKNETEGLLIQLKSLKDEYREVIVLRFLNEMDIAEIAEALEKTPNHVRVTLHRALKSLRTLTSRK